MLQLKHTMTLGAPASDPDIDDSPRFDTGLAALCMVAGFYRIAADPSLLSHKLALGVRLAEAEDIVRAGNTLGLKSRTVRVADLGRLSSLPLPAIVRLENGGYAVIALGAEKGTFRRIDVTTRIAADVPAETVLAECAGEAVLVTRRLGGAGVDPKTFGFTWFLPSIFRYRKALSQVLIASLFIQIFALVTPIFFQLVIDKVLVHKGLSTLIVLVIGLVTLGLFETILQYLRSYTLNHTTNRMDVELGRRLFHHLFHLPLSYFETRPAGQTVARVRELETIRSFLTGQGLTSVLDLVFTRSFHRGAVRLFAEADAGRHRLDPGLYPDCEPDPADPQGPDQREVQPWGKIAAVPGGIDRRRADAEGRQRRADDAGAVGGEARRLCAHLL